jgi:hypothetical protein
LVLISAKRLSRTQGHTAAGRIRLIEKSNHLNGNRTRELTAYNSASTNYATACPLSHRDKYEKFYLLGDNTEQLVEKQPTFWRNISHPSSGLKRNSSKKLERRVGIRTEAAVIEVLSQHLPEKEIQGKPSVREAHVRDSNPTPPEYECCYVKQLHMFVIQGTHVARAVTKPRAVLVLNYAKPSSTDGRFRLVCCATKALRRVITTGPECHYGGQDIRGFLFAFDPERH